jgi:acid phosphatase type 7
MFSLLFVLACAPEPTGEVRAAEDGSSLATPVGSVSTSTATSSTVPTTTSEPTLSTPPHTADTGPTLSVPLRVGVISDLNGSYGSVDYSDDVHAAVARLIELKPDVVLSTGDMVAGQQGGLDHEAMWDAFHAAVSDPLHDASIPFAVSPGNHDASGYASYVEERELFVEEWELRRPDLTFVSDADYPLRYAFSAPSGALFLSLDDTTVGALDEAQMTWIGDVLEQPGYSTKIVFGHLPLYPFAVGRETEVIGDEELEQLLLDGEVDLFLSGHHHAYFPGRRGALRLVGLACLGSGARSLIGEPASSPKSFVLFEIVDGEVGAMAAWTGEDFTEMVDPASLPDAVGLGAEIITFGG